MKLIATVEPLHPRAVFRISRAQRREVRNVFVRLGEGEFVGYGEASPNAFYGESADEVCAKLTRVDAWLRGQTARTAEDIERIWREVWPLVQPSRAAQCALDVALWDLAAKREGCTVAELALGEKPRAVASFCTIGISSREELEEKIAALESFPLIKIKMDHTADLDVVRRVRERTNAKLAVDANCAWRGLDIAALSRALADLGVLFIEQPLPPDEDAQMPQWLATSALPFIADESCAARADVERMSGHFSGFNIKLVKCGGLTPALAMLQRGHALGLRTMVGCMLESSVLIAAGAVVAQQTDFADLDGAWLLRDDPFDGWRFEDGMLRPSGEPGLGVEVRLG